MGCAKRAEANGRPLREARDKADRPKSPVPPGCGNTQRLRRCAPRHRRTNYDLRRAPRIDPRFARNAIRVGLIQRFPKCEYSHFRLRMAVLD